MRQMGYRVIDLLVDYWQSLPDQPLGKRATRQEMEALLREPLPLHGSPFEEVIRQFQADVLPNIINVDHPRYFAFVPAPNNYIGTLADTLAAGMNIFAGTWMVGAGATQVELVVMDWIRLMLGMPETAGGLFVSGGSVANLIALAAARHHLLGEDFSRGAVYFSDQTHSCVERALRVLGFRPDQMRRIPCDYQFRLPTQTVREQIKQDRASGWQPFCIVVSAGTTNTGAVDPLPELADLCQQESLWLHADGAYGAVGVLSEKGKKLLEGIELLDSLAIDPHKWFYQPMAAGCVLVKRFEHLKEAFHILPPYLQDKERWGDSVDLCDYGIELSRGFRALKLWMSLKVHGLEAFRQAITHNIELAEHAEACLRPLPDWEIVSPATLGILAFRYAPEGFTPEQTDALNKQLVEEMIADGFAMVSSTILRGHVALRMCTLSHRATFEDVAETVQRLDAFAQRPI
jgi:aromatic-L-amino-acid decarboxylase